MNAAVFTAAVLAGSVSAQISVSNPVVDVSGCDVLLCPYQDNNSNFLCSSDANVRGLGMAQQVIPLPGSDTNLSLSLLDGQPQGILSAPYEYSFMTQKLYIGAPADVNLQEQPAGCALMFQYQAQTFPFLDTGASPNSTQCGDALSSGQMDNIARQIENFNYGAGSNDTESGVNLPRCAALALYLDYQLNNDPSFGAYFYEGLVTVTGGAFSGPDVNTTSDAVQYGDCQPVRPSEYELYNVLDAQQVLQPDAAGNPGRGGRNGTTPVMTVTFEEDGAIADVQMLCMQQLAPGNQQLPQETMEYEGSAPRWHANFGMAGLALAVVALSQSLI